MAAIFMARTEMTGAPPSSAAVKLTAPSSPAPADAHTQHASAARTDARREKANGIANSPLPPSSELAEERDLQH